MVIISAYEAMPPDVDPEARVLYFSPDPAGDQLGNKDVFEMLLAADFQGGRFIVKHALHSQLAGEAHDRLTRGGRYWRNFGAADTIARRAVASMVLFGMGTADNEASSICGVHRNVLVNDRRRFRDSLYTASNTEALRKAFQMGYFTVNHSVELTIDSIPNYELQALCWLAEGRPTKQAAAADQASLWHDDPERTPAYGRTILSRAWRRLGVNDITSATLLLQLVNNLPKRLPPTG